MTRAHIVRRFPTLAARFIPRTVVAGLVTGAVLLAVTMVQAATPEQVCRSGKNKTAGKYAGCRANAEAKLATGGNLSKYADALGKCETKFSTTWQKVEAKATAASASCPADDATIKGQTDAFSARMAALMGGNRFVDNGDGTVTDQQAGLQWEKKTNLDGFSNFADPHDADNTYTWTATSLATPPDGTAFTAFLDQLNGGLGPNTCLAGHCDWRLPTLEELQTILLEPYPCATNPCIDPIFGAAPVRTWSASTVATNPAGASDVDFVDGYLESSWKYIPRFVRAVRTAS